MESVRMGRAMNGTVHPAHLQYKRRYINCSLEDYKNYRSNAWRRLRKRLKRKGVVEVDLDHHRYKLLMSLNRGIREVMLCRRSDPQMGDLRVDDFCQVEERQVTRPDGRVFIFESYANKVFFHLRQSLDIRESEFLESVAPESLPYLEFISNSNSGQKFYLSNDMKYMFKTDKECSIQFFFSILGDYLHHFQDYPHSLLVRFLGLYSIKLPKEKKIYFLVMQSVFYPCDKIEDRFDIKGFTTLRYQKPYPPNKNIITVLKDKNFADEVIDVGSQKSWFQKQLEIDVEFLRSLGVQDYSLLVGRQSQKSVKKPSSLSTIVRRVSRSLQPSSGFLPSVSASKATSTTTLSHKSSCSNENQPMHTRTSPSPKSDLSPTLKTTRSALSATEVEGFPQCCERASRESTAEPCLQCQLALRCEWRSETESMQSSEMAMMGLRSDSCMDCQSVSSGGDLAGFELPSKFPVGERADAKSSTASGRMSLSEKSAASPDGVSQIRTEDTGSMKQEFVLQNGGVKTLPASLKEACRDGDMTELRELESWAVPREDSKLSERSKVSVLDGFNSLGSRPPSSSRTSVVTSLTGNAECPNVQMSTAMPVVDCSVQTERNSGRSDKTPHSDLTVNADGDASNSAASSSCRSHHASSRNHATVHHSESCSNPKVKSERESEICNGGPSFHQTHHATIGNVHSDGKNSAPVKVGAAGKQTRPSDRPRLSLEPKAKRLTSRTSGGGSKSRSGAWVSRSPRSFLPYPQSLHVLENARMENRRLLPACENALHIMDGPKYRYYLGIIDFFTRFECRQKVGSIFHCCKRIDLVYSSVDPEAYAHRFLRFIDDHLK